MEPNTAPGEAGLRKSRRAAPWGLAALLLVLPFVAMQLTDEVSWGPGDFGLLAAMLFGACGIYELAARRTVDRAYRAAAAIALVSALSLGWVNLAVGVIGAEDNPANLMYFAVLIVGVAGALMARFRPRGMARTMVAVAVAQVAVGIIAWAAGLGSTGQSLLLNGGFAAVWLLSASLFRKASEPKQAYPATA
jgi:hypothetical protein